MASVGSLGVYIFLFIALYFEVFLLITFLGHRPEKRTPALPKRYPKVCIVVPCLNEERTIGRTLESLLALVYPTEKLSIMVVDDGSTDSTATIAKTFAGQYPQVEYHYKERGGKYTAVNYAITHTDAELVGCLDADSFVDANALNEMVKKFETSPDVWALTPAMKVFRPRNIIELMQAVEYTFGIFYKKMFDYLHAIPVLPGPFSIYRRAVFDKIGLFRHAHNTEDMEIAFRMHANKLEMGNVHTAYVYTTVPSNVRSLIKQRTRWSQGFLQNSLDYRYMYFNPRFGNFGFLALPMGLISFAAGIYTSSFLIYSLLSAATTKAATIASTGIPVQLAVAHIGWFYLNTSMINFLAITVVCMTILAVFIGQRMTESKLPIQSFFCFFLLFGFVAPFWLVQSLWGALRAQESVWR